MFGPIMRFQTKTGLTIKLGPLSSKVMEQFIAGEGGMQRYEVHKFLGRTSAPVLEDETDWFNKTRSENTSIVWGVYVVQDSEEKLIGTTGLHGIEAGDYKPYLSATSGFMIFDPEFWGKGIAGACHRARTMYAFDVLGVVIIRSAVIVQNKASKRAIESVGYVVNHTDRMPGLHKGEPREEYCFWCVNPDDYAWNYWWRGRKLPRKWQEARQKTQAALDWARQNVELA